MVTDEVNDFPAAQEYEEYGEPYPVPTRSWTSMISVEILRNEKNLFDKTIG